jgi:AraC-like DNA-binding protein
MQITFTSGPNRQSQLNLAYPKEFNGAAHIEQRTSSASAEWGNMKIKELWFEGVCLFNSSFNVNAPYTMNLQCDSFCWVMNFVLDGKLTSRSNKEQITLLLEKGQYHTFYCSALDIDMVVNQPTEVFTICLTQRFIRKLLGKDILPENFEGGGQEPFTLVTADEYRDGRFKVLIKEMVQAGQPDYIRRIFLEAKILELLSMQLERLENKQLSPGNFSKEDVSRLEEAKTLVEQNLQTPCSLIELARKTGLNDFKLKKGFKELFGHTVFGYLFELRMDSAYQLLKEGKTVGEVSEIVGYKNSHHFTSAFKKKYNLLPSQIGKILTFILSSYAFSALSTCFLD